MTSSNGSISRVTGPFWGESTGHRWIPLKKSSDAELWCILWSAPEQTLEQPIETSVISDATHSLWPPWQWRQSWQHENHCPASRTTLVATRFRVAVICPIKCLTVLQFSFILFDLCLLITFFNFIMNYVPIVTFWIFTYHKIWILSIMFCSIWSYWIIYFLACLEVSWRVVS